jgi:hypothetical protein
MLVLSGITGNGMTTTNPSDRVAAQPNSHKPSKLIHAATHAGYVLPVIDVTGPRFAVPDDPGSLRTLFNASHDEERRNRHIPKFIMRLLLKSAAKKSLIVRALFASDATFLDGLTTYVMKLGADNLPPPYDSPMDRRAAGSPHLTLLRLRTQQVARLIADGLASELAAAPTAPLHLVNIAGGPAIDSLNALILLNRRDGNLRRPIAIHVLDPDDAGPFFGRNALAALMADGAPLTGLAIAFNHHSYDWNEPAPLEALLRDLSADGSIVAASSEGGLFEYGGDEAIVANLKALRAGGARLAAGSVTSDDEAHRRNITASRFKLIPRGLTGFAPLAARAGFTIARAESAQLSEQVLLRPV